MKEATLIFPDATSMAEFIMEKRVSGLQTNSRALSISGFLPDGDIANACIKFNAVVELKPVVLWDNF